MEISRYNSSRQKACDNCSKAKAKCDRKARGCRRCALRGLQCSLRTVALSTHTPEQLDIISDQEPSRLSDLELYSYLESSGRLPRAWTGNSGIQERRYNEAPNISNQAAGVSRFSFNISNTQPGPAYHTNNGVLATSSFDEQAYHNGNASFPALIDDDDDLNFSNLDLTCPINADAIRNRWLNHNLAVNQTTTNYRGLVTTFIHQTLKAYTSKLIHNSGFPPFVHPNQKPTDSNFSPLLTCLGLTRICEQPFRDGDNIAAEALEREMNSLYERIRDLDQANLLSAFQAYLLYTMIFYFKAEHESSAFIRKAMMNLQNIGSLVCQSGIMCVAEQQNPQTRPEWEAWIIAESRRRTLYVMYLFDSLLSARDGFPSLFLGVELQGLPAPSTRQLWYAQSRRSWEARYDAHLAAWVMGGLRIGELWLTPQEDDDSFVQGRRYRLEQWLGDADEFGASLYAVTCCTHG